METPDNPTLISHRLREAFARVATVMRIDDWERAKRAGINPTQLAILELLEGRDPAVWEARIEPLGREARR